MTINSREMLVRDIADALQTHVEGISRWFLNLTEQETGIWFDPVYADPNYPWPKDNDKVIEIKKIPSHEVFGTMESFADEQPKEITEELYLALNGNKPFARFRAAVETLGLLQDWYAFQNAWYKKKAEEWMQENGVDFKNGMVVASCHTINWNNDY